MSNVEKLRLALISIELEIEKVQKEKISLMENTERIKALTNKKSKVLALLHPNSID